MSALEIAAQYDPDVVLLDIGLPALDGYSVAERLRDTGTVLIAMTGYGQPQDAVRAQKAGFVEHMVKPVDHDLLTTLLASLPSPMDAHSQPIGR